jgi:hypothetical protein
MSYSTTLMLTGSILLLAATVAFGQGITIDLGKTETGRYMNLVGDFPGSDGEIFDMIFISPEYAATNKGTSMYFAIDDSFFYQMPEGWSVIVNVEYYDAPGVQIKLVYDARDNHAGKEHPESIASAGTNKWRSKSFLIDDAYFGNGLGHGADLKLVAAAGAMTINAVSVVPFEAYFDYGSVNDSLSMNWTERQGGDSYTEIVTKDSEECVMTVGANNYLYVDVADTFLNGGEPTKNVFVAVEYYDADPTMGFRMQYDAITSIFKATPYVYGKGWNSFRTYTFEISDAFFMNRGSGPTDLRLHIPIPGLAVNRILIARLPKKPLPTTNIIPDFTAYKVLDSPLVDGSLKEWGWLTPCAVIQQYNPDHSRSDEFYRTWMLNSDDIPMAEAGEPVVSDPAVPGDWDPKDLGGGVSVMWDDTNLYFAVNVKDNVVNTAGANWDNKDGFGFYIDVSHVYDITGTAPLARGDDEGLMQGEHFFFFPADQAQAGTWCHSASQTGEAMPGSVAKSVVRTDSGYIIETSVPLSLIADGLTWHPGVVGDKDAFNPLFAWMINDNDGVSASSGRVMYGGHNADDEFWGTLKMTPTPLVDRGIMIDLGAKNYECFLKQVETQDGGDGVTTPVERAGKIGVMLSSSYLYLDISDTVWNAASHKHALVSVEYFDSASVGARFRLQYESDSTIYQSLPYVNITNTNLWKTTIFELTNAKFQSHQDGHADFRIDNGSTDVVVNQVHVAMADLWIDLADSTVGNNIIEGQTLYDGVTIPITVGGVNCKRNDTGYTNTASYFYFAVADSVIYGGNHPKLFVTVEYYDTLSSCGIGMSYDGAGSAWSNAAGDAFTTGSDNWKLHTFYVQDAEFRSWVPASSDFRILSKGSGTTFINRVLIGSLDGVTTSVDSKQAGPLTFRLDQNYPNPFNPATTIRLELPERSHVHLSVFNILGQQVAELANEEMSAGYFERTWNAKVASGMYFCRIVATALDNPNKRLVDVKKMILLK